MCAKKLSKLEANVEVRGFDRMSNYLLVICSFFLVLYMIYL
jgi:hypothetical protein